jgi:O-antigen/teichoic acid export membrane protein
MTATALVLSGILVNALLAVVARSVSPAEYALFSAFWSVALVAGFGVFLPIEQWLAQSRDTWNQVWGDAVRATRLVAILVAIEAVLLVSLGGPLFWSLGGRVSMLVALAALCAVSGTQFLARGVLIGLKRFDLFSAVLLLDVVVRLAAVLAFSLGSVDAATPYAWAVVIGIALAHLPVLAVVFSRGHYRAQPSTSEMTRPILLLLIGSLGAQVLFNGPAVAVVAAASAAQLPDVGTFQAAFQLVRIPLFLAVPVQATLVPVMTRVLHGKAARERVSLLTRFTVATALLASAGVATGWLLGPWLVHLVFGQQYDATSGLVAVLAAGTAAYLALLVLTQVFVADGRHAAVGGAWGVGVLVAAIAFVIADDGTSGAAWAFTIGCAGGLAFALAAALHSTTRDLPADSAAEPPA